VDTHAEVHVAAALDERGRLLGTCTIPTTSTGFMELVRWADQCGEPARVAIEGTGSYGAGLARWLGARDITVIEVDRPDRRTVGVEGSRTASTQRRRHAAVLAGVATAQPKAGTGAMEMVRSLRVARQSALKARTQAANELHALVVTAPDATRAELRRLKLAQLVTRAAAFRRSAELTTSTAATKLALKSVALRYQHLSAEIDALDKHLDQLVAAAAPALVAIKGVGTDIAATLLTVAGDNPARLVSEGAFAHLVGVAPIEASSGKITRYRLNVVGMAGSKRMLCGGPRRPW